MNIRFIRMGKLIKQHSPQEITLPNGEWGSNCVICDGMAYPCLVVQVVTDLFHITQNDFKWDLT